MNRRQRFTTFLILLLLLSAFVAAPHFHENTADNHDCPICVVSHHQTAANQSAAASDVVPCIIETTFVPTASFFTENIFADSLNNRGPPA
jgi:hypothetical protein